MTRPEVADAVHVDEIGLEAGVFRNLRIRSAYRPVFECSGNELRIAAVHAVTAYSRAGSSLANFDPAAIGDPDEKQLLTELCRTLHIRNRRHLDLSCDLILEHDLSGNRHLIETVTKARHDADAVGAEPIGADRIVCRLGTASVDHHAMLAVAELRDVGFRLAVAPFDGGFDLLKLRPDIVEIGGSWTTRIAQSPAAADLLRQLVAHHRGEDACVLLDGISTRTDMEFALDVGADWLAGDLFGPPAAAGAPFGDQAKRLGAFGVKLAALGAGHR